MADRSAIEWTDASWTPIRARNLATGKVGWHCVHKSDGCRNCYAEGINRRLGTGLAFKKQVEPQVEVFLDETMLTQPLRWRRPRMIFVCSMTDLFADFVTDAMIDRVFAAMALAPQHTFQVLTKRPDRMREYLGRMESGVSNIPSTFLRIAAAIGELGEDITPNKLRAKWPLPNVWLGTSAERQQEADERIPDLLATPAAVRFLSAEPLLGPIDLHPNLLGFPAGHPAACACGHGHGFTRCPNYGQVSSICHKPRCPCPGFRKARGADGLHWVIAGGESGPGARPMHPDWARQLRDQCAAAGVPFFFKQWGEWTPGVNVTRHKGMVQTATWFDDQWDIDDENLANDEGHVDDEPDLYRVGKKAAGRLLDGDLHDGFPGKGPSDDA